MEELKFVCFLSLGVVGFIVAVGVGLAVVGLLFRALGLE